MADRDARHVGDGIERSGGAVERDAEVARPLRAALGRGVSTGGEQQQCQADSDDQGVPGERKMK
jgi:hypothetical protein